MVVGWDRDAQVPDKLPYASLVDYSSARTYQLGDLTSGRIISSSLYPTTIGEKSEMWSTDRIMSVANPPGVANPDKIKNLIDYLQGSRAQWNPVLAIAVPDPAVFKARVTFVAAVRARGVRFNRNWLAKFSENDRKKLPVAVGGMKIALQTGSNRSTGTLKEVTEISTDKLIPLWNYMYDQSNPPQGTGQSVLVYSLAQFASLAANSDKGTYTLAPATGGQQYDG